MNRPHIAQNSVRRRLRVPQPASAARAGLSLFEVVISLAIFMGALAAIGQLISIGVRGATDAKLKTQAVIRCEMTLGELLSGYMSLQTKSGTFADDPKWSYSVSVASAQHEGLYIVEVTTTHDAQATMGKVKCTLRRFVRDPANEIAAYEQELALAEAKAAAASSSSSSSTTSSGGSR
jgi:general secretion pathway protein I